MKLIISILVLVFSTLTFASSMSTIDLLVREAASSDLGEIFYDEWQLTDAEHVEGCLMTVKASTSYILKNERVLIAGTYCVIRDDSNFLDVKRVTTN